MEAKLQKKSKDAGKKKRDEMSLEMEEKSMVEQLQVSLKDKEFQVEKLQRELHDRTEELDESSSTFDAKFKR